MAGLSGTQTPEEIPGTGDMTVERETLKRLLGKARIHEPGKNAREKARQAMMAEFHRLKEAEQKKIKGISRRGRLTDKILGGGSVMRKPLAVTAGITIGFIALIVAVLPHYFTLKGKPAHTGFYLAAPSVEDVRKPSETAPRSAPAGPLLKPRIERFTATDLSSGVAQGDAGRPDRVYSGRDRFEAVTPNPVKAASEERVSTFSIDVDTASYAFVRRALNSGVLPQKHSVRIEELINYFDYDYPLPSDRKIPFRPTVAVLPTPWNPDTKLLHIGIRGLDIVPEKRPAANLVFLIDVSGSMQSRDKLPLLKSALRMLVDTLDPEDVVSIVVYAGAAGTVLEPTKIKEKGKILAVLDRLRSGGSTAGGEGIRKAYTLAEANFDPEGVNRVILATDGDFNVGIRDPEELKGFVERKRRTDIYLSVLGFGQGNYNDALMQKLAQNGNGNAAYIDSLNEARKVLVEEAGATLFTIARDVKIQVEFNPARVAEYRLIGYETRLLRREDFKNDAVDAGDIGSGHKVTAIYEMTPVGSSGRLIEEFRYTKPETDDRTSSGRHGDEIAFLKIRYKLPDSEASELIKTPIGRDKEYSEIENASGEARFAVAVAAFGQLLRGDPYTKDFTYDDVIALADPARGKDRFGYRSEFLNLVRLAKTARAMGDR
jgi:Ca-activated chloride channel family protein